MGVNRQKRFYENKASLKIKNKKGKIIALISVFMLFQPISNPF